MGIQCWLWQIGDRDKIGWKGCSQCSALAACPGNVAHSSVHSSNSGVWELKRRKRPIARRQHNVGFPPLCRSHALGSGVPSITTVLLEPQAVPSRWAKLKKVGPRTTKRLASPCFQRPAKVQSKLSLLPSTSIPQRYPILHSLR
jgi:hypothetical protein